jgi:hypothetical protein
MGVASACRLIGNSYAVTNDSVPALTRAVAALPAGNSVLDLLKDTYTIGSTWLVTGIHAAGMGKTVLVCDPQFKGVLIRIVGAGFAITGLRTSGRGHRLPRGYVSRKRLIKGAGLDEAKRKWLLCWH